MAVYSPELVDFFLKKGAPRNCPSQLFYDYLYPHSTIIDEDRHINPERYAAGIRVAPEGTVCNGEKRLLSGEFRRACVPCNIRGIIFTDMNDVNYLKILGPINPTQRGEDVYGKPQTP